MPLIVTTLAQDIKAAEQAASKAPNMEAATEIHAQLLAAAIDKYIKSGLVTVATSTGPATGTML